MLEADRASRGPLDPRLLELVRVRASQINGCAYCLETHARAAQELGESERRLHLLAAWRDADDFSPRERAAFAWTEAVTLVAESRVSDAVFDEAKAHFGDEELAHLTYVIATINAWNRLNVAFRTPPRRAAPAEASAADASQPIGPT